MSIYGASDSANKKTKRVYTFVNRKKGPPKRIVSILHPLSHRSIILDVSKQCHYKCLNKVNEHDILVIRRSYLSKNQMERSQWIKTYLDNNIIKEDNAIAGIHWHINGNEVCFHCWKVATTVSSYKLRHCNRTIHGSHGISKNKPYVRTAIAWMGNAFSAMCEKMPTKEEFHLPCFLQWKDICADLNYYLRQHDLHEITDHYFCRLRKKYYPKVKAPKYTRQGKCDECISLKNSKHSATFSEEKRKYHDLFVEHNKKQMSERLLYKTRCIEGETNPKQVLSIILDGMATVRIPWHMPMPKGSARVDRLKLHVHGLIDHSNKVRKLYGSLEHWSHGANYVATVLANYINELRSKTNVEDWPKTLYLQVDNCWKENKNKTMFFFLGILIVRGWFENIYLYSLPTGHTHEDIDQLFSNWNTHYWKKGLQSPEEIDSFLVWSYPNETTRPTFKMMEMVYDMKSWFENFGISMKHHTAHRAFHFQKFKDNVQFFYKPSSLNNQWFGLEGSSSDGIILFYQLPFHYEIPFQHNYQSLDLDIIDIIIKTPTITKYLDSIHLQWYLKLFSNNTFYFKSPLKSFFPEIGPLLNIQSNDNESEDEDEPQIITVDAIQQHLLRYGVTEEDKGKFILAHFQCYGLSFLLGKVVKVDDSEIKVHIYFCEVDWKTTKWTPVPNYYEIIQKKDVFKVGVQLSKKETLDKKTIKLIEEICSPVELQ